MLMLVTTARPAFADNVREREWHVAALGLAEAHRLSQGDGVIVAVMDTGVDARHTELTGAVLPGKGFGEGNSSDGRSDSFGHGTAVAGLIAGRGLPNGGGVLGVAPKAMILPLQTLRGDDGLGVPGFLAEGIDWAVANGAKVICVAGGTSENGQVREAVERALKADVVVVAAVGNTPRQTTVAFPAKLPGVLAVGGTDRNGEHASMSVAGPEIQVTAPAVEIISTGLSGDYTVSMGTSDATAIVAGVVALVRAKYPSLSGAEVVHRITATATDKGKPGRDEEYGFGIVNPVAALTADVAPVPPSAAVSSAPARSAGAGVKWGFGLGVGVVVVLIGVFVIGRRAVARR